MQETADGSPDLAQQRYVVAPRAGRDRVVAGRERVPRRGDTALRSADLTASQDSRHSQELPPTVNGPLSGKCPVSPSPQDDGLVPRFARKDGASATVVLAERRPLGAGDLHPVTKATFGTIMRSRAGRALDAARQEACGRDSSDARRRSAAIRTIDDA